MDIFYIIFFSGRAKDHDHRNPTYGKSLSWTVLTFLKTGKCYSII